jgi:hypothetical protein
MPLRILAGSLLDTGSAAVDFGTAVSGYPASHVLTHRRSDAARIQSVLNGADYASNLIVTQAADFAFNAVVAAGLAIPTTGTLNAFARNAAGTNIFGSAMPILPWTSTLDSLDSATARSVNSSALWLGSTTSGVRSLVLQQRTSTALVHEAARFMAGIYKELTLNFDWENSLQWVDPGESSTTYGGDLIATYNGPLRRKITLPFNGVPEVDRAYLYDLMRVVGTSGELFISMWPGAGGRLERDHQMWCRIANTDALKNTTPGRFGSSITFIEC